MGRTHASLITCAGLRPGSSVGVLLLVATVAETVLADETTPDGCPVCAIYTPSPTAGSAFSMPYEWLSYTVVVILIMLSALFSG